MPRVVVFQVDFEIRLDQLVLDKPPDDPCHLAAVELDDRVCHFDLRHRCHPRVRAAGHWPVPLPAPKIRAGTSRDKRPKGRASQPMGDARMRIVHTTSIGGETRLKCGMKSGCYELVTHGDRDF